MHSADVINVLDYLESQAVNGLMKRDDLGRLLELGATHQDHETLNSLIFNGAHFHNLHSILRRTPSAAEGYQTLQGQFAAAMATVRTLLENVLAYSDDAEFLERCQALYFAMSQGGVRNLLDLCHDLWVLKCVQNDKRRESPSSG